MNSTETKDGVTIERGEFKGYSTLKLTDATVSPDKAKSICFGVSKAKLILKALPEIQALAAKAK